MSDKNTRGIIALRYHLLHMCYHLLVYYIINEQNVFCVLHLSGLCELSCPFGSNTCQSSAGDHTSAETAWYAGALVMTSLKTFAVWR